MPLAWEPPLSSPRRPRRYGHVAARARHTLAALVLRSRTSPRAPRRPRGAGTESSRGQYARPRHSRDAPSPGVTQCARQSRVQGRAQQRRTLPPPAPRRAAQNRPHGARVHTCVRCASGHTRTMRVRAGVRAPASSCTLALLAELDARAGCFRGGCASTSALRTWHTRGIAAATTGRRPHSTHRADGDSSGDKGGVWFAATTLATPSFDGAFHSFRHVGILYAFTVKFFERAAAYTALGPRRHLRAGRLSSFEPVLFGPHHVPHSEPRPFYGRACSPTAAAIRAALRCLRALLRARIWPRRAPSPYALFVLHPRWPPLAAATRLRRFAPGVYRPGVPRLAVAPL